MMPPCKNVHVSESQKELLLNYMIEHEEFAMGRFLGPLGRKRCNKMWDDLAKQLNSMGTGATKTTQKWRTSWSDWKLKTKTKASGIARYARGTGGGPAPSNKLSNLEEKLLAFLGPEVVTGDQAIAEAGFPCNDEVNVPEEVPQGLFVIQQGVHEVAEHDKGTFVYTYEEEMQGQQLDDLLMTAASCCNTSMPISINSPPVEAQTGGNKRKKTTPNDVSSLWTKKFDIAKDTHIENSCNCNHVACGCCSHLEQYEIHLNSTICSNVTYLSEDYGISFTVTVDHNTIFNETVSARNPPPVCSKAPYVEDLADVCVRLSDIQATKRSLHACASVEARMRHIRVARYNLGCFTIGNKTFMEALKRVFQHVNDTVPVVQLV